MIEILVLLTLLALFIPIYVYVGYPILLILLDKILKGKPLHKADITPSLTFIVSCYNEVDVIEQKIQNCLTLDYPQDAIEIIFVSDGIRRRH